MSKVKKFEEMSIKDILEISNTIWKKSSDDYKNSLDKENKLKTVYKDGLKYRYYHCKITADLVLDLYSKNKIIKAIEQNILALKILYMSALLHDIRKFNNKHGVEGAKWIKENLRLFVEIDDEVLECICALVRSHKSTKIETEKVVINDVLIPLKELLYILQISDEASKMKEKIYLREISM